MSPALILRSVAVFAFAVLLACDALAAVGTVQFSVGDVRIRDAAGKVRATQKGDAINEGDTILTGRDASAQIKMSDGGILAIRTDTELKIDTYRFAGKEDGKENAVMSLLKGGFRTITGVIGRTNRDNYKINTATATIGIRGTDHEPHVILPPALGAPQPPAPPGTYDKVNVGAAFISSPLGTVNVAQNQVGFAAPNQAPVILPQVPGFFKATPPITVQKPGAKPAAAAPSAVRDTAIVDSTSTVTSPTTTTTTTTTATTTTATTTTQTVEATTSSPTGTATLDLTGQTVTSGQFVFDLATGTTTDTTTGTSFQQTVVSGGQLTIGDFGLLAQQQSTAAQASLSNATSAANAILSPLQTTATTSNTTLQAIAPVDTSQATSLIAAVLSVQQTSPSLVDANQLTIAQDQLNAAIAANATIGTAQTSASTSVSKIASQLSIAQTAVGSGTTTLDPNPTQASSSVASACGTALACADLAAQYAAAATTAQSAQNVTAAQNAFNNATTAAGRAASFETTATNALTAAQAAATNVASQLTVATNAKTAATTANTASLAAAQLAVGDFGVLAQFSADSALAAKNSINTIGTALGTAADTAAQQLLNAASTANTTAQADASTIAGIAAINTTAASTNLASTTTLANTATSQVSTATSVNTANSNVANGVGGTDFRDSQAAAALTAMNTANTAVQGALTTATSANTSATTQSGLLTTAKSSAVTQSGTATTAFNTAQTTFNALTAAAQVDTATTNANQTVSNLLSLATTAANNAQAAANLAKSFQTAQDFTNAQAQFNIAQAENAKAQAYLGLVQQVQTVAQNRDSVVTAQGQLATLLTSANTAKSTGDTAVATTTTALSTANTNATSVAQQAVIAQYNNPTIASGNRFSSVGVGAKQTSAGSNTRFQSFTVNKGNTNFVLDGQKNLVESRVTDSILLDQGGVFNPSAGILGTDMTIVGGTAADTFVAFTNTAGSENYVALGRWTGGQVQSNGTTIMDLGTGAGARSFHWIVGYEPPAGYVSNTKLTGTTTYSKIGSTSPTDASGNVGTLNSATFSVDFTALKATAGVDVTVASKTLNATGSNIPFLVAGAPQFGGTFATVGCTGTCTGSYSGDLTGSLTGTKADGAGFVYSLFPVGTAGNPYTDLIQGAVAFLAGTPPALVPQPAANFATAYLYGGANISATTFQASGTTYTLDGSNNLTTVSEDPLQTDSARSETTSGGTALTRGQVTSTGGSVLDFGRWQGGTVSGTDFSGSFANRAVDGTYHWLKGPAIAPFYLPQALTTTGTYSTFSGQVTDQASVAGTIDSGTTMTVNFNTQKVDFTINATTGAGAWQGAATGVRLEGGGQFFAATGTNSPHNNMTVTLGGSATGTFGIVDGTLMGNGADAAGVGFAFGQGASNRAAGVVAFTGTAQSQSASYVAGIVAAGNLGTPMNNAFPPASTTGTTTLASLDTDLANSVEGIVMASSRVSRDGAATPQVVKFDADVPVAQPTGCSSTGTACTGVSQTPATFSLRDASFPLDTPPGVGAPASPTTLTNTGSEATTGITWGRYVGFVSYTDRVGGTTNTTGNNAIPPGAFDARTSNWHGIWSPAQTSAPVLPISGTITYTAAGGTNPTDSLGNVGTWSTSTATLSANFTAMTVNTSVNAVVGPNTWAASASNVPIVNGTYFQAQKAGGVGNLSVTMNGNATGTAGKITGIFTGNAVAASPPAGSAGGAMLGYALNQGGAAGTTMQGVTAFKK